MRTLQRTLDGMQGRTSCSLHESYNAKRSLRRIDNAYRKVPERSDRQIANGMMMNKIKINSILLYYMLNSKIIDEAPVMRETNHDYITTTRKFLETKNRRGRKRK